MKSKKASEPGSEVIESKILVVATSSFSLRFTLTSRACLPVCLRARDSSGGEEETLLFRENRNNFVMVRTPNASPRLSSFLSLLSNTTEFDEFLLY